MKKNYFRKQSTYCNIMEGRPCRAACFDWEFIDVAKTGPAARRGTFRERKNFLKMIERLNFTIYMYPTNKKTIITRNLPKQNFIEELKRCEYGVECIYIYITLLYFWPLY